MASLSRQNLREEDRRDFYAYLDEWPSYATDSIGNLMSEARKYRVSLCLSNQSLCQVEEKLRNAVLGNVGSIISFRVGLDDARLLAREFYPDFAEVDLVNLPRYHIYLKLMIDGVVSKPFSEVTLGPIFST